MDRNSSVILSNSFAPNSGYKAYPLQHITLPTNGLAEAFNKTIGKMLKKFVSRSKRDWDKKLGECLWAYRTTVQIPTKATPFSLVYEAEAALPLDTHIQSPRVTLTTQMTEEFTTTSPGCHMLKGTI